MINFGNGLGMSGRPCARVASAPLSAIPTSRHQVVLRAFFTNGWRKRLVPCRLRPRLAVDAGADEALLSVAASSVAAGSALMTTPEIPLLLLPTASACGASALAFVAGPAGGSAETLFSAPPALPEE